MEAEIQIFPLQPPESIQELLNSIRLNPATEEMDPHKQEAAAYIKENRDSIVTLIKNQTDYWTRILESLKASVNDKKPKPLDAVIEHGNFLIICKTIICNGTVRACLITVVNKQWGKERLRYIQEIFNSDDLSEKDKAQDVFPVELLAKRLGIQEKRSFQITQTFNPKPEEKYYGVKIDGRIKELVRLLNEIGIKTVEACLGHRLGMYNRPYIMFEENHLTHLTALLLALENAGGAKWRIKPHKDEFVKYISLVPAPNISLAKAHTDIDTLTNFLIEKTSQHATERLTPIEIAHRIRRAIFDALDL